MLTSSTWIASGADDTGGRPSRSMAKIVSRPSAASPVTMISGAEELPISSCPTATIDARPSSPSPKEISGDEPPGLTSCRMAIIDRRPSSASPMWISGSDSGRGSFTSGGISSGGRLSGGRVRRSPW